MHLSSEFPYEGRQCYYTHFTGVELGDRATRELVQHHATSLWQGKKLILAMDNSQVGKELNTIDFRKHCPVSNIYVVIFKLANEASDAYQKVLENSSWRKVFIALILIYWVMYRI